MTAYYNELDQKAAAWLRELIKNGHIAYGDVDERSIEDVTPNELSEYTQCHFFAGIGGWSLALRLAGWPDDRPVWTGSCPCQSFSAAGKGAGFADERHLWPAWFHLINQCRPSVVFGEQVGAAINHGWLDLVQSDMEAADYSVGAVCVPAAGVGAPHIRDRLWFVADNDYQRSQGRRGVQECAAECAAGSRGVADGMGIPDSAGSQQGFATSTTSRHGGSAVAASGSDAARPNNGVWRDADWLLCRDAKWRCVEPGTFPLANGVSERVVKLRGYGNAIVPQVAAEFIQAYQEITQSTAK